LEPKILPFLSWNTSLGGVKLHIDNLNVDLWDGTNGMTYNILFRLYTARGGTSWSQESTLESSRLSSVSSALKDLWADCQHVNYEKKFIWGWPGCDQS
jgi:hypothetical protein